MILLACKWWLCFRPVISGHNACKSTTAKNRRFYYSLFYRHAWFWIVRSCVGSSSNVAVGNEVKGPRRPGAFTVVHAPELFCVGADNFERHKKPHLAARQRNETVSHCKCEGRRRVTER
jgi:hypothetical protein